MSDRVYSPNLVSLSACGTLLNATTSLSEQMEARGIGDDEIVSVVAVVMPKGFTEITIPASESKDGKSFTYYELGSLRGHLVFPTPFGMPAVVDVKTTYKVDENSLKYKSTQTKFKRARVF